MRETSKNRREALIERLSTSGVIRSRAIYQAFAAIPREAFIPFFYQYQEEERHWIPRFPTDLPGDAWLEAVYTDESLVTKLSERNAPMCSSSMPSVMARMLEVLDVQPGMSVLEIGTGTGYNAALLATLTGNPTCVTTIEVDAPIAERARDALRRTVGEIQVQIGDGLRGARGKQAQFDRIIATASCRAFPWAWYHQLAPGGRLVMDLQGGLCVSSFCILEKSSDGTRASGSFQMPPLYFMPIQEERIPAAPGASSPLTNWSPSGDDPLPLLLQSDAFRWFAQWCLPGLSGSQGAIMHPRTRERVAFLRFRDQTGTRLDLERRANGEWHVQCLGSIALWEALERVSVQ